LPSSNAVDILLRVGDLLSCCTPLVGSSLTDAEAAELERLFKLVADRTRIRILNILLRAEGEPVCVCELTDALDVSQPTVSHHLKQLTAAGLLERERRGSYVYFSLAPGALERVAALLAQPAGASPR
jgi:ArsR family transcriptional regulator